MTTITCGPGGAISSPLAARTQEQFPDPFFDYASTAMPRTLKDGLLFCEYIVSSNGPYREALSRVVSYFVTDIEILAVGEDRLGTEEKKKYLTFFNDVLKIRAQLVSMALDYMTYGNLFLSVMVPFSRYLRTNCGCGYEVTFKEFTQQETFSYAWNAYQFNGQCPRCGKTHAWERIDRRTRDSADLRLKLWRPHELDIDYDEFSQDSQYIWRIPEDYRLQIRRGDLFQLERADWEVVKVIKENHDLLFDKSTLLHLKEPSLSGIRARGWGISRVLSNFRHAYYYAILHRYNEAIALDYVVPFRVLTPVARAGGQTAESMDPLLGGNLGLFRAQVERMLRLRRQDPTRWNVLPYPVDYKALGGDATQLAPKDLLEQALKTLLDAIGVPSDLYSATLSAQAAPAALRLFEANWSGLIQAMNIALQFIADKVAVFMSWEPVVVKLKRVTHADDLNKQMAMLQLMMGGQISKTTGLGSLNLDFLEEERTKLDEERRSAEETARVQEELEAAQLQKDLPEAMSQQAEQAAASQGGAQGMPTMQGMPGAMPAGGMPPPATGGQAPAMPIPGAPGAFAANVIPTGGNVTLEQLAGQAATIAQQLMPLPPSIRNSNISQLRKQNEALAMLVQSHIRKLTRDAELRGRELILAQEYGQTQ